ncbi:hypothetical protein F5X96DRAFT_643938 [Biscogniauxia mediterranea]|nr:hypothetical protein F5X96DRAFT_643938 [Biscogniauxia mediterranea]
MSYPTYGYTLGTLQVHIITYIPTTFHRNSTFRPSEQKIDSSQLSYVWYVWDVWTRLDRKMNLHAVNGPFTTFLFYFVILHHFFHLPPFASPSLLFCAFFSFLIVMGA